MGQYFYGCSRIGPDKTFLTVEKFSTENGECRFLVIDYISPSVFRIRLNNENSFPEGGVVRYGIVNTKCKCHQVKSTTEGNIIELLTEQAKLSQAGL